MTERLREKAWRLGVSRGNGEGAVTERLREGSAGREAP
jgi:hypothetical protein